MSRWTSLLERWGLPAAESERTLWLVGERPEAFEAVAATIETITRRYSRLRLILSGGDAALRATLARRFPDCRVMPPPLDRALAVELFLRRCNVRVALFLEPAGEVPAALLDGLKRRAITVVAASARGEAHLAPGAKLAAASETLIEISAAAPGPAQNGARRRRLTVEETVDLLGEMLARDLKPLRRSARHRRGPGAALRALAHHPRWQRFVGWRIGRIASLAQLREALGAPRTILCLGNGPSSEDPALSTLAYDALFRVNHSWQKRGLFIRPDVVFTGGKPTMRAVRGPIFGLQTQDAEERFAAIAAFAPTPRPGRFFNVNDMTDSLGAFAWGNLRPTNGATMLAVAVALQPSRLIVAGIDLFQHRDGTYPGDKSTPNDYSPGHSRDTELTFLLTLLSNYRGELIILGDVLRSEWEKYGRKAHPRQIDP